MEFATIFCHQSLQENSWFAAVLEGVSGGFEPPQHSIVIDEKLLHIVASAEYIATVLWTVVQTAANNIASVKTVAISKIEFCILNSFAAVLNCRYCIEIFVCFSGGFKPPQYLYYFFKKNFLAFFFAVICSFPGFFFFIFSSFFIS
jgi:hypothetical protein